MKPLIASILYCLGIKPKITTFIDEATLSYGYGYLHGTGVWEYQIEAHWILKRLNARYNLALMGRYSPKFRYRKDSK